MERARSERVPDGERPPVVDVRLSAAQHVGGLSNRAVAGLLNPALRSSGEPLPVPLADSLGSALGADLTAVRVHRSEASARAATALGANAFTVGQDIHFAPNRYDPTGPAGQHLLRHEVAHAAYPGPTPVGGSGELTVSRPSDPAERWAESFARGAAGRPAAAGRASQDTVYRSESPDAQPLPAATVKQHGIAHQLQGASLRDTPSPQGTVTAVLPFNTRVFVDSDQSGWYFVTTDDGRWGYCARSDIKTGLPEPAAKIHWIAPNERALDISRKHYGGTAEWGSDHRFYVNGLVLVNGGEGERGIYKPSADAKWEDTQTRAGFMIWVPSLAFMKTLHGKVPSGSITHEAWETVKGAAEAVAEFAVGGAAFIAGLLHGALESLWDVLVGLTDLAVMLWDILKSLFTGHLVSDAKELWEQLKNLDWGALVEGWLDRFTDRWNAPGLLERWHFRGWVAGYAIMEVLLLVFSGGVISGIKWVGKAAKPAKVIAGLPKVQKLVEAVKASEAAERLARALARGGSIADDAAVAVRWIGQLLVNPKIIWGRSPEEIADVLRLAGRTVTARQSKKGSKLAQILEVKGDNKIMQIQVHPGGGRHQGSYYKISTSDRGIIKVVDKATYKPIPGEKATIIYMPDLEGWLVRAVAANSLAQRAGEQIPVDAVADEEE